MLLSILVPTIPARKKVVQELLEKIERMVDGYNDVQVLCLYDNLSVTTGTKRQKLFDAADGEYIQFIDDDDDIYDEYLDTVYPLLVNEKPDLITYQFRYTDDAGADRLYVFDDPNERPNHTHLWRKGVITHPFQDIKTGEDRAWAEVNVPNVVNRVHIPKTLYHYRYNSKTTEAQK